MKRIFLIALGATTLAVASGSAFAANDSGSSAFESMDTNNNGQISQSEFEAYYSDQDVFDMWDANGDGWIDEDEFGDGLFGYYDTNDDGYIDDAEWENGVMVDDYGEAGLWDS